MNIFKAFKDNVLGQTGQHASHNGRYLNPDGTHYGSSGLARVVTSPTAKLNMTLVALGGASLSLLQHNAQPMLDLLETLAPIIAVKEAASRINWLGNKRVIDSQGSAGSDPAARSLFWNYLRITGADLGIGVAAVAIVPTALQLYMAAAITLSSASTVFNLRASRKIKRGDWTVLETPPPPPAWEPQRAYQMQPAFAWAPRR